MNSANDKYGPSLDRPLGSGKPVDPATRLSELLAQSLEELTRPFDPPRPGAASGPAPQQARPTVPEAMAVAQPQSPEAAAHDLLLPPEEPPEPSSEQTRIDADKALAELEAELFAAAKQVDSDASIPHPENDDEKTGPALEPLDLPAAGEAHTATAPTPHEEETRATEEASLAGLVPTRASADASTDPAPDPEPEPDAATANLVARVRRLMLVSMAITVIGLGSVFAFIGYRISQGEGSTAKTADKLPEASTIPNDITLSLPRGARIIQAAVSNDRLLITLEVDGKTEVRTFDVKTLQPAGRLSFTGTP